MSPARAIVAERAAVRAALRRVQHPRQRGPRWAVAAETADRQRELSLLRDLFIEYSPFADVAVAGVVALAVEGVISVIDAMASEKSTPG